MSFLQELRRRKVFRLAALYIVSAWVVLQVADLAFESWDITSSALRYIWLGAILGFPVALIFGWRYDIVGGRIVRTLDSKTPAELSLQRSDYLILTALTALVVATIYGVSVEISAIPVPESQEAVATSINPRSIAVLPFTNSSQNQDNTDFLANGIQDDLLTKLSKISALGVISRTSAERYRNTTKSIRVIGKELGVGKILEGGVQRAGNQFRVNVQLIDTVTDEHLWAETYDRSLTATNIFAVQSEIVETIVQQLKANLSPQETQRLNAMPTKNLDAYTNYLKRCL